MDHRPRLRTIIALALGVVLVTAHVVAAQSAEPEPQPSALAAQPSPTPGLGTLPAYSRPLDPGRYASAALGPTLTFELADDDWKGDQADGLYLELVRQIGDAQGVLSMSLFDGLVADDPCELGPATRQLDMTAAAFTDWLTGLPVLSSSTTPTTFLGLPATQVDATVIGSSCPSSPFLLLWDGFRLFPSEAVRIIAVDVGDRVLVMSAETLQSTDQQDFLDVAQPVIDSMAMAEGDAAAAASPSP